MSPGRLRWRCRRGMRELDLLLTRYLDTAYDRAGQAEQAAFEALLEQPDEDLWRYLFEQAAPAEARLTELVDKIRRTAAPHP